MVGAATAVAAIAQTGDNFTVKETPHGLDISVTDGVVTLPALETLIHEQTTSDGGKTLTTKLENIRINVRDGSLTLPLVSEIDQSLIGSGANNATVITDLSRIRINVTDGTLIMPITSTIDQSIGAVGSPFAATNTARIETNLSDVRINVRDGTVTIPVRATIRQGITVYGGPGLVATANNDALADVHISHVTVFAHNGTVTLPASGFVTQRITAYAPANSNVDFTGHNHGLANANVSDLRSRLCGNSNVAATTLTSVNQNTSLNENTNAGPPPFLHRMMSPSRLR